jgi:hypothetical protein
MVGPQNRAFVERRQQLRADHKRKVTVVATEAANIADCAQRVANAADEARESGDHLNIQPQIGYLTGALARLIKDWGVVEHLQKFQALARPQTGD